MHRVSKDKKHLRIYHSGSSTELIIVCNHKTVEIRIHEREGYYVKAINDEDVKEVIRFLQEWLDGNNS